MAAVSNAEVALQRSNALLETIRQAQSQFITAVDRQTIFDDLLSGLLALTESEYGFIGEVFYAEDGTAAIQEGYLKQRGQPYLQTHSITNIAWDEETQRLYEESLATGMRFDNLKTLFGAVIMTEKPVIANSPSTDPRRGGTPAGHPPLNAFLGLPFFGNNQLIGMIGIANRDGGYDQAIVDYLQPFLFTCINLIEGYRLERKATQSVARLQASEQRYRTLLGNASDAILIANAEGFIVDANRQAEELFGYSVAEITQLHGTQLHPPEALEPVRHHFETLVTERGKGKPIESLVICKDGSIKPVEITACRIEYEDGVFTQGILRDISERKRTELALLESQQKFQRMTENVPGMIYRYVLYPDGRDEVLYVSPQCREIFEVEPDMAVKDIDLMWERVHPDDVLEIKAGLEYSAKTLTPYTRETRLKFPNGKIRWIRDIARPKREDSGAVVWDGIVFDINQSKTYEERLEQTNAELKRATQLKDEFLASMSHELRTPLNAILGMSELLTNGTYGNLDPQQAKAIETIAKSGGHLLELINDILDLAKIEAGKITLELETVGLQSLCEQSLPLVRYQAEKKGITLNVRFPRQKIGLWVDPRRLHQALLNLLSNAVKFTPAGGQVSLLAYVRPDSDWLYFDVADTGIGIAPGDRHKLFQPFVQIDSNLNRQYSGTGLGLALVKRIAELHGGQVVFTSELGKGSCFSLVLPKTAIVPGFLSDPPLSSAPTAPRSPLASGSGSTSPSAPGPRLVIAEDNPDTLDALQDYLIPRGYHVTTAENGQAAIDLIRRHKPDLVLMDIQMPIMDGLEAMQIIRQDPDLQDLPIIALTALAMTGDQERLLSSGATDYLSKPFKLSQLDHLIRGLLANASPSGHSP
ncbi:MAG: PAS domain S-box protein [Synechocystis sp.]|nr:PAS domain S-box protein [Synechocystis sp.]